MTEEHTHTLPSLVHPPGRNRPDAMHSMTLRNISPGRQKSGLAVAMQFFTNSSMICRHSSKVHVKMLQGNSLNKEVHFRDILTQVLRPAQSGRRRRISISTRHTVTKEGSPLHTDWKMEREEGKEGGRKGGREKGREGGRRKGGREKGREGGREKGKEGGSCIVLKQYFTSKRTTVGMMVPNCGCQLVTIATFFWECYKQLRTNCHFVYETL